MVGDVHVHSLVPTGITAAATLRLLPSIGSMTTPEVELPDELSHRRAEVGP